MSQPTRGSERQTTPCDCHSYNGDFGKTPEVVLTSPDGKVTASIDACMAHVIQHLWDNGVWTIGSCCGHGGKLGFPSILLSENVDQYRYVRQLISEVDDRHFEISQWKRVVL